MCNFLPSLGGPETHGGRFDWGVSMGGGVSLGMYRGFSKTYLHELVKKGLSSIPVSSLPSPRLSPLWGADVCSEVVPASRLLKTSANQNPGFLTYVILQNQHRGSWEKLPVLLLILRSIYKIGSCVEQMNMKWNLPIKGFWFFFLSDSLI